MQDEITRRRWEMQQQRPTTFKPIEALKAMVMDIENGDLDPEHIVIIYNKAVGDEEHATGYYQAGRFSRLESLGLVAQALHIMGEKE
jgi:hypothetical protein